MTGTALTPQRFDQIVPERYRPEKPIWTLEAIGQRIGVGADFVRTLAKLPGSPVREIGGRYYAFEADLMAFLKSGNANPDQTT